jgi:hypothetical protein
MVRISAIEAECIKMVLLRELDQQSNVMSAMTIVHSFTELLTQWMQDEATNGSASRLPVYIESYGQDIVQRYTDVVFKFYFSMSCSIFEVNIQFIKTLPTLKLNFNFINVIN